MTTGVGGMMIVLVAMVMTGPDCDGCGWYDDDACCHGDDWT